MILPLNHRQEKTQRQASEPKNFGIFHGVDLSSAIIDFPELRDVTPEDFHLTNYFFDDPKFP